MNQKTMYRVFGFLAFLVAMVTYTMTVQPTVPFWDCGEFSGASVWQQVPHPPGAPLFLMFGKLFQIIIPFGDIGWRINMASVVASALSVLLLYLITVKVIYNFRKDNNLSNGEYLAIYGSAFVGALAFNFSDTFWFNGVESEVYAASQLFVSIVVYLMMRWNEVADEKGHERYLLLIAYLMGLSTGVHLLALLAIFSIILMVYFRKYPFTAKSFIKMGIFAVLAFFIIYPGIVKWLPSFLAGHFPFKNELGEYTTEGSWVPWIAILGICAVAYGFYYGHKNDKPVLKLGCLAFLMCVFGYTTYTQILLRTHANGPMNENEPKTFAELTSYLGREQYGDQKMWPRRTDYQDPTKVDLYNSQDANGEYVYGEWYPPVPKPVEGKNGVYQIPSFDEVNTAGEINYMLKYQINHMYIRYFLWNFVGRSSDVQDAPPTFLDKNSADALNYKNGYAEEFPVRFFALPLLFGLFGLFFHFWKDPKVAFSFLMMFLLMGILATLQQNQQDPQPRERDYFYTGSFYVFAMWIGMGTYGIISWLVKRKENLALTGAIVALSLILVPVNMAKGGWKIHSRAGNYLAFDYSYNLLQSVEKDAIVFTNGDNDTFPVWWMQDVAGVRRDVRIVNLSLGNTLWYIRQLKHREPWGAKKIPLTFSDESIMCSESSEMALTYERGKAEDVEISVKPEILKQFTNDRDIINSGKMRFTFVGSARGEKDEAGNPLYIFMVSNKLVKDIVAQTKFERPVYFSCTTGSDVYSGLERYLRSEGMALRICPVPAELMKDGKSNAEVNDQCLLTGVDNSDNYSLTPKFGFKFRNLANKDVYYDEVHRNLMGSYRQLYFRYALYTLDFKKDKAKAIQIMDAMNKNISIEQFPLYQDEELQVAMIYERAGNKQRAEEFANHCVKTCNEIMKNSKLRDGRRRYRIPSMFDEIVGQPGTYKTVAEAYTILGKYDQAKSALMQLMDMVKSGFDDPSVAQYKNYLQRNLYDIAGQIYSIDSKHLERLVKSGQKEKAQKVADDLMATYGKNREFAQIGLMIGERINQLLGKAPELVQDTAQADSNAATAATAAADVQAN